MEVYLTFDDGVQAGTEEVLDVLRETGVKATFFLIGNELQYARKRDQHTLLKLLQQMNALHDIGLHSYSHANFYFTDYYLNNGVQIDSDGTLRSIVDDFKKGKELIIECLDKNVGNTDKGLNLHLARLPGRNSTCIPRGLTNEPREFKKTLFHCEKGTEGCTKELFEAGFDIFGWNVEWKMSFELHKEALDQKKLIENFTGVDYQVNEQLYPDLNMYAVEHIEKDRLTEDWTSVLNKIKKTGERQGKVILLMHDRAFRKGGKDASGNVVPHSRSQADQLHALIVHLKQMQVSFKGLSEFNY